MIELPLIPVEVSPERLAAVTGRSESTARDFLAETAVYLHPAGLFAETRPEEIFPLVGLNIQWTMGPSIIVGLVSLNPEVCLAASSPEHAALARAYENLALADVLDYFEYRVARYLKPTGRRPGDRLIPGCPDLPLAVNRAILDFFGLERTMGLTVNNDGELIGPGLALIYPATELGARRGCQNCPRRECPARQVSGAEG